MGIHNSTIYMVYTTYNSLCVICNSYGYPSLAVIMDAIDTRVLLLKED